MTKRGWIRPVTEIILRQSVLVTAAVLAYFGIRVLDLELTLGLEQGVQDLVLKNGLLIDLANWVYT